LNLPEQQVEAVAFAWLANQTLNKKFNNSPDVTGAKGFRILGSIHQS
jgi:anhydro-N-acetylmuramic acid kinase